MISTIVIPSFFELDVEMLEELDEFCEANDILLRLLPVPGDSRPTFSGLHSVELKGVSVEETEKHKEARRLVRAKIRELSH